MVESLDAALLFMHSPLDEIVGIDNAARLYDMARLWVRTTEKETGADE